MADTTKATASNASSDVQAEFDAVRRDIANLSDAVTTLLGETTGEAKDRVRERAKETAAAAKEAAGAAGSRVTTFVEEKPTTSLLIAFGTGLLFGSLVRRS